MTVNTHQAHFAVTRDQHFTLDNMFCAAVISVKKEQLNKWKRKRRTGLQYCSFGPSKENIGN